MSLDDCVWYHFIFLEFKCLYGIDSVSCSDLPSGEDKSQLVEKIMEYVKNDDVRNLKRLLGRRSRDDVNILCNVPARSGWSSVTSAADFGNVDVLK